MFGNFFCDGNLIHTQVASSLLFDVSFQRGYGAFELLRTYNGVPFELGMHLKRLENSCKLLSIPLEFELEALREHIESYPYKEDLCIRIYVTVGSGVGTGHVYTIFEPITHSPKSFYQDGIAAITTKESRFQPECKSTNYIASLHALRTTMYPNVQEVLFLNSEGYILEGGTSNIFGVIDGKLYTAPHGVLKGITRSTVLDLFQGEVVQKFFSIDQLDECFLTGSLREVMPITSVNGKPIREGIVGQKTKEVISRFSAYKKGYATQQKTII